MARMTAGARMTNAPTSTLPGMSIYAVAAGNFKLRELWIYNTAAATACMVALQRLTTAGTQGAAVVEHEYDTDANPVIATVVT